MLLGNPFDKNEPKKAYAKAQINGEMSLKELSTEVSKRSTVHRADVSGVLIATVECMFEALKSGKQVDFGELGKFRLQLSSDGAESAEKFTSNHITGASIQFIPGDDLKNLFANLDFNVVATRAAQAANPCTTPCGVAINNLFGGLNTHEKTYFEHSVGAGHGDGYDPRCRIGRRNRHGLCFRQP